MEILQHFWGSSHLLFSSSLAPNKYHIFWTTHRANGWKALSGGWRSARDGPSVGLVMEIGYEEKRYILLHLLVMNNAKTKIKVFIGPPTPPVNFQKTNVKGNNPIRIMVICILELRTEHQMTLPHNFSAWNALKIRWTIDVNLFFQQTANNKRETIILYSYLPCVLNLKNDHIVVASDQILSNTNSFCCNSQLVNSCHVTELVSSLGSRTDFSSK